MARPLAIIRDPNTGRTVTIFNDAGLEDAQLQQRAFEFLRTGKTVEGLRIQETTPQVEEAPTVTGRLGQRLATGQSLFGTGGVPTQAELEAAQDPTIGQRVGAGLRSARETLVDLIAAGLSPVPQAMRELQPRAPGERPGIARTFADIAVPRSLTELGLEIGALIPAVAPAAVPALAATRAATRAPTLLPRVARRLGRAALPGVGAGIGAAIEQEPILPAVATGTAAGLIGEAPSLLRGAGQAVFGERVLQPGDIGRVSQAIDSVLPPDAPKLAGKTVSGIKDVVATTQLPESLDKFATALFRTRLDQIDDLSAGLRITVKSISDDPITVRQAIDEISAAGFRLTPGRDPTGAAKQVLRNRDQLMDEVLEALKDAKAPREIEGLYNEARREFRRSQAVIRLFQPAGVFDETTGRLNIQALQRRFTELRRKKTSGIDPELDQRLKEALFRGARGPKGELDISRFDQPGEFAFGLFTRATPGTQPPGLAVRRFAPAFFPGAAFGQPGIPSALTTAATGIALQRAQEAPVRRRRRVVTGPQVPVQLKSSPFGVEQ